MPSHYRQPDHSDDTTIGKVLRQFIRSGERRTGKGLGAELGTVELEEGTTVDAGRTLMRDTWNADLHATLQITFDEGQSITRPDVWVHKNRNSGMYDPESSCIELIERKGIRTLLFTGQNTDQCVIGTLQDAYLKGYDTILLKGGCGTDGPDFAQKSAEYNCLRSWGF